MKSSDAEVGNVQSLLARIHHPERAGRSIVVAGTNGKGSVTAMIAAVLQQSGLRVGRYTSPHVYSVTERVCIDRVMPRPANRSSIFPMPTTA